MVRFGDGFANASEVLEPAEVSIKFAAGLKTRAQVSKASTARARIAGDFGSHVPPSVVAFSARDVSSAGYGYTRGDELTISKVGLQAVEIKVDLEQLKDSVAELLQE